MRRRLLWSTLLITLVAIVVLGLPLGVVGTSLLHQRADMRLERRADAAALRVANAVAHDTPLTTSLVADLLPPRQAVEVTVGRRRVTLGTLPTGRVVRVTSGDGGPLRATLVAPAHERGDDVAEVWLAILGLACLALVSAVGLAVVQARRLAAPLEQLARRVERVGDPAYDARPVAGSLPEVDRVQSAINDADERVSDVIRREREFTANVSHQLRTPLTGLRLRIEEVRDLADSAQTTAEADAALQQVDRLVSTIEHLETVARHRDDEPAAVDVGALVANHLGSGRWPSRYGEARRSLTVQSATGIVGHADPESIRQILDVLLDNSLRHGEGTTAVETREEAGFVRVRVADQGHVAGGARSNAIFARGVGHGSGIGLAVARDLARRSGGDVVLVEASPTAFEAILPSADADVGV